MILVLGTDRLYREVVPKNDEYEGAPGQYEYWYKGAWHLLQNPDFGRLLDDGFDPHVVRLQRNAECDEQAWLSRLAEGAEWLPSRVDDRPDEPLNAPAALIRVHEVLVEHGLADTANLLARMMAQAESAVPVWPRAARTVASEYEMEVLIRTYEKRQEGKKDNG